MLQMYRVDTARPAGVEKATQQTGYVVSRDGDEGEKCEGEGEGEVVEDGKSPPSRWE